MSLSENIQTICLILLEIGVVLGALGVVLLPNIVYSAFLLGGVSLCIAGIYLLLNAEFIAAAQILIYVGAINVLILFAIMLVNKADKGKINSSNLLKTNLVTLLSITFFILIVQVIDKTDWDSVTATEPSAFYKLLTNKTAIDGVNNLTTISFIGFHIFSDFLLPFEIVSVLLLVTLVGAVVIARREQVSENEQTKFSELDLPKPDLILIDESSRIRFSLKDKKTSLD